MTNEQLKDLIKEEVTDEEILEKIIVLEGDEFADGVIGLSHDYHLIYDYNKLVDSLMSHNNWSIEEAVDWLEFNTLRSLDYMKSIGNEPIIMMSNF